MNACNSHLLMRGTLFSLLLSTFSSAVLAQSTVLEEIIVTAERRETGLQDTPISVNAVTAQALENAGINDIEDLQNIAPSLVASGNRASGNANMSVAIRGIGQRGARAATGRGVGLYIDDVYFPVTQGSRVSFQDVSRIEILRGPQGTLFGRNNVGGAIRYFTNPADIDATYGSIQVKAGEFDRMDFQGIGNLSLSDSLAARVVVSHEERDGYMKFVDINGARTGREALGAYENDMLRLSLAWDVNDLVSMNLIVEDVSAFDNGVVYDVLSMPNINAGYAARLRDAYVNEGLTLAADDPRFLTSSEYTSLDACLMDGDGLFTTAGVDSDPANPFPNCDTGRQTDLQSVRFKLDWELSDLMSLSAITGYGEVDVANHIDWTTFGAYMRLEEDSISFWSQEFQLNGVSEDSRLNWVAGINFSGMDAQENLNIWDVSPGGLDPRVNNTQAQTFNDSAWGAFAQGTYSLTDRMNLTLGLRYTDEDKDIASSRSNRNDNFVVENTAGWSDTNMRVTLDYAWTDDIMTYVTYADAFKAGSFNTNLDDACNRALTGDPLVCDDASEIINFASVEALDPEQVKSIEFGLRSEFNDRVRLNMTVFSMDYTDLQQRSRIEDPNDPDCTGGFEDGVCAGLFQPGSIGAEIKGVETEILYAATDSVTLTANISKIDTKVTEAGGVAGLDLGRPLDQAPELNYTLGITHITELSGFELSSSLNYSYKDEYFPMFTSDDSYPIQELVTMSARVQLQPLDGPWSLALGVTNLTDETYETNINHWRNFIGELRTSDRQEPQEWYLQFNYRFGDQ